MNDNEYARDDFDEFDDDEYCDQENDMKYVLTAYLTFTLLAPPTDNSFFRYDAYHCGSRNQYVSSL